MLTCDCVIFLIGRISFMKCVSTMIYSVFRFSKWTFKHIFLWNYPKRGRSPRNGAEKNVDNRPHDQWTVSGSRSQSCQRLPAKIVLKTFESDKKGVNNFNNVLKTYYSTSKHLIWKKHRQKIIQYLAVSNLFYANQHCARSAWFCCGASHICLIWDPNI